MKLRVAWAVLAFTLISLTISAAEGPSSSPELSKFFAQYFEEQLRDEPEYATMVGRHEYDDRWSDLSKQGRERRRAHLQRTLEELQKFSSSNLSQEDRLSVSLLVYDVRNRLDALDLETHLLLVGQLYGAHNRVYVIVDRMPAFTVKIATTSSLGCERSLRM